MTCSGYPEPDWGLLVFAFAEALAPASHLFSFATVKSWEAVMSERKPLRQYAYIEMKGKFSDQIDECAVSLAKLWKAGASKMRKKYEV